MQRRRGFTLLELMIVVLVVAILAALAMSGYQKQVRKSRRAEAKQVLADFSLRQEKWRTNNTTYASCDNLLATTTCANYNASTALSYYSVAVTFPSSGTCPVASGTGPAKGSANSYILTATPKTADQAKDTECASMVLASDCGTISKTPATCF